MSTHGVRPTVMLLDDEPIVCELLQVYLEQNDYTVLTAGSYKEFIKRMTDCDAILCDIILPGDNGLRALAWARKHYPNTPVIMMTGAPTYETAAEAIRLGAYDYLAKPIDHDELLATLARAIQHRQLALEKERLEAENEVYRLELEQRVAERTRALRHSQEFLSTLTETMADVVFSLKMPGYCIEYVNQAVTQILGYQPKELLGQTIEILYPSQTSFEAFIQKQATAIAAGQNQTRLEQLLQRADGQPIWTEIATTFIYTDGQVSQLISVVRDITHRSLLLSVVAHELRAPLALLTGFSEVLVDDVTNIDRESLTKYLGTINRVSTRMVKMLDELLDVTTIELGRGSPEIERLELNDFLKIQVDDYQHLARQKNITLKASLPAEPLVCQCDLVKISQVVSNFIDNAIKYSAPRTTIELIGRKQGGDIWVGVKDEGPGIKPEEVQYLFQGFGHMKISSRPTAGEKSTGLGLVLCKKIIEAHGGQIGVESTLGQGSTFWFNLPGE